MLSYRKNYYSQFGEDGVLEYLCKKLNIGKNGTCCEFGAWDGKASSNTFHLVKNKGFRALYIEADVEKFKDLLETCKEYPKIVPVNEYVNKNLDDIFEKYNFPYDIDVLSIDIDSTDYEQWKTCIKVNSKIVIIEPDNTVPSWIKKPIYPVKSSGGANYFILEQLGKEKGYTLACNTSNMIFVRSDLVTSDLEIDDRLFPWHLEPSLKQYIFSMASNPDIIPDDERREEYIKYCKGITIGYIDWTMKTVT